MPGVAKSFECLALFGASKVQVVMYADKAKKLADTAAQDQVQVGRAGSWAVVVRSHKVP